MEPLVSGYTGALVPEGVVSCTTLADGYTEVYVSPDTYEVLLSSGVPVRVSEFSIKVDSVCSDGSALTVDFEYRLSTNDFIVSKA